MAFKKVLVIRHGITKLNERHAYLGGTDEPLSENGRKALSELKPKYEAVLSELTNPRFVTSGMKRTEETVRILFGDRPTETIPELREINFGVFEGKSYGELKEDPAYQTWISGDNEKNVCPEGESGEEMTARVLAGFEKILGEPGDVVIVTHGGPMAAVMMKLFPNAFANRYEAQTKPGEGYLLAIENEAVSYQKIPEST